MSACIRMARTARRRVRLFSRRLFCREKQPAAGRARYLTGPLISVSDEVWLCFLVSTQVSDTVAPGLYWSMTPVRPLAVLTACPLTPVITSPARTPALYAGVPGYTLQTRAPDWVGTW